MLANHLIQLSGELSGLSNVFEDYERAFPFLVLSLMSLTVMVFLERIIRGRTETEQNLELAQVSLERAGIPVFWFTPEGEIRYVNGGAREFLGYSHEELLSMTIHDIAPPYLPAEWRQDWSSLKEGGSTNIELYLSTKDGQLVPVDRLITIAVSKLMITKRLSLAWNHRTLSKRHAIGDTATTADCLMFHLIKHMPRTVK